MIKQYAADIFNYRPLTLIGLIGALHMIAYGVGYTIPTSGFQSTVLYDSIAEIMSTFSVGVFFILSGLYSIWAWIGDHPKHISWSCSILAFFWMFASFCYFVNGAPALGVGIGFVWSLLHGYLAFAYKNKSEIARANVVDDFD